MLKLMSWLVQSKSVPFCKTHVKKVCNEEMVFNNLEVRSSSLKVYTQKYCRKEGDPVNKANIHVLPYNGIIEVVGNDTNY